MRLKPVNNLSTMVDVLSTSHSIKVIRTQMVGRYAWGGYPDTPPELPKRF